MKLRALFATTVFVHQTLVSGFLPTSTLPQSIRFLKFSRIKLASTTSITTDRDHTTITLSEDPKVVLLENFISPEECQKYISKVNNHDESGNGVSMEQSNAPEVSLNTSRLWPLPFLCLGAGLPPVVRLWEHSDPSSPIEFNQILSQALPPIITAFGVTACLTVFMLQAIKGYAQSSSRTSQAMALNSIHDEEFIRSLVDKVSDVTTDDIHHHPWTNWEAPVITKYQPGSIFSSHNDASPTRGSEWSDLGGQRVVTVITYLNTCHEGGGTKFDKLGITVQPKAGSALVFYPADYETWEADERTVHQSLKAVEEKYIVQMFGRGKRVPPPLGIPDSFGKLK